MALKEKLRTARIGFIFLEQFTSKELVRRCQFMCPDKGYAMAKEPLNMHFGDDHKISISYLDMILNWPVIKTEDAEALQAYSIFLNGCLNAMNHPTNIKPFSINYLTKSRKMANKGI